MTEHPGFLADIIEHPDDDTPRLVYADWLEIEAGEAERAEFIRVQCELATLRQLEEWPTQIIRRVTYLMKRERQLDAIHRREWIADFIAVFACGPLWHVEFSRGFVEKVRAPLDRLRKHLPELVPCHPLRRALATDSSPRLLPAGHWGWWAWSDAVPDDEPVARHDLPYAVWRLLPLPTTDTDSFGWKVFATEGGALDALSGALLAEAWGRGLAQSHRQG